MIGKKVLVFSPHPDDETIGCGGTIAKVIKDGGETTIVWMTSGEYGTKNRKKNRKQLEIREKEAKRAAKTLGVNKYYFLRQPDAFLVRSDKVIEKLSKIISTHKPDTILSSYWDKMNNDHIETFNIVKRASLFSENSLKSFLCYEVWNPLEDCNHYEDISDFIDLKLKALSAYKSQLDILPYDEAIKGLNRYRGLMGAGVEYAEGFKVIYSVN